MNNQATIKHQSTIGFVIHHPFDKSVVKVVQIVFCQSDDAVSVVLATFANFKQRRHIIIHHQKTTA